MAPRESSNSRPAWASRRAIVAGAAAVALAAGGTAAVLATHHPAADRHAGSSKARLAAASCGGPAGGAYVALPGYQAFDAVDTANCKLIQQYNVDDLSVPGTGTEDTNYGSSEEGVAMYGNTLYFADTGSDSVAVIDAADLNVDNYANPAETIINVGINPQSLAVTPDGSQVW